MSTTLLRRVNGAFEGGQGLRFSIEGSSPMKSIALWIVGVPISVIVLLNIFNVI